MKTFLLLILTVISSLSLAQSPQTIDADCLRIQDGVCIDKNELGYIDGVTSNVQTQINGLISDTAYDATTWNGVTAVAPSKNAVRDQIEAMLTIISGNVSDTAYNATSWDGVTTIAPSKNAVRDQVETLVTSIATKQATLTNSAGLAAALSDETGTGAAVMAVSPALTGTPTVPTAALDTNTTQAASTAYVKTQIAGDTTVVHTTGNESVAGTKTYTGKTVASSTANGFHPCPTMTQTQRDAVSSPANGDCVHNSTTNKLNVYNSGTTLWEEAGSSTGSGGTDYISNDDAEANTSGWSCYADAAAATPVDGTGGSPATAIAVSASSPLSGAQSFVITKSTTQGEGCSYAFTIDSAYKAKTLRISFPYETTSLVDGSFRVYIYDVTNSRLIDVDTRDINANTFGQFIGSFQTSSDSVSYRLIIHGADTTAGSLKFDKGDPVTLGPQTLVKGPVLTNWQSYTPTFVGFGTVSPIEVQYRRVGDTLEIYGQFTSGTTTGVTATMSLPAGLSISTPMTNAQAGGWLVRATSSGTSKGSTVILDTGSPTVVRFSDPGYLGTGTTSGLGAALGTAFPSSERYSIRVAVPIAGWSSSQTLSEDGGTKQIVAQGYLNGAQSGITDKVVPFDTKIEDTASMCNFTTGVCTIPESGDYDATSNAQLLNLDGATDANINLRKNGSAVAQNFCYRLASGGTSTAACNVAKTISFSKGDTFDVYIDGDASFDIVSNIARTTFTLAKRSSPQTLAGGETVAVSALQSSGTSLPSTGSTDISWDSTKSYETHTGSISGTTFSAPASGKYKSCTRLKLSSASWTSGNSYSMSVFKNGSVFKYLEDSQISATASLELNLSGCTDLYLSKGDALKINVSHNRTGGAVTISASTTQNYWDIVKVGN
jgi:hypothetical protein